MDTINNPNNFGEDYKLFGSESDEESSMSLENNCIYSKANNDKIEEEEQNKYNNLKNRYQQKRTPSSANKSKKLSLIF